jgi:hypothetical protein
MSINKITFTLYLFNLLVDGFKIKTRSYYSGGFTTSPTQFQLGRERTNATTLIRCYFFCVGNVENVEAGLERLIISPTY